MKSFACAHRDRVWAVEGARGVGAALAQRLVAEGEPVLDVPPRLSARVPALGGGSGRKTDDADAFAVAVAGLRPETCRWCDPTTPPRSCGCSAPVRRSPRNGSPP